jgi:hypothetical protein
MGHFSRNGLPASATIRLLLLTETAINGKRLNVPGLKVALKMLVSLVRFQSSAPFSKKSFQLPAWGNS